MPCVKDICRHVRSKNAGPFWVTIDLFFEFENDFARFAGSPELQPEAIGRLFAVDPALVKHFALPTLRVVKISFPRRASQGGMVERDLHCGQLFVRLLDVELTPPTARETH